MKRHLILHIGLSKTGSSSIQRVLAEQRQAMQALGVYYPRSPGWANHALLPALLVNDPRMLWGFHPDRWEGMTPAARMERFRVEWSEEMGALPEWAERCVISAEQIGGLLRDDDEVQRLADLLARYFATVKVVVYLRRQDQHIASAYSQWLRSGILQDPGMPSGGPERFTEYDYGPMLDRYARAFGDSAMCPRIFSRKTLVGGDVVEDFFEVAGFKLPIPPEAPNKAANLSINLDGQALLLAAGRWLAPKIGGENLGDRPEWRRIAESVSERFPGSGWRPTQKEARDFMTRFEATNEHARRRFFPDQPSLFSTDFSDLPELPVQTDPARVVASALELSVYEMNRSIAREADAAMAQFRLLRRLDDRRGMRTVLIRAIKYAPDLLAARLRMAELCLEEGDMLVAHEHIEVAARLAPDDPKVRQLLRRSKRTEASAA
jgi:hypothetical protein